MSSYEAEFYERYDDWTTRSAQIVSPLLIELAAQPESVIDVGCGIGQWLAAMSQQGVEIQGLDGEWVDADQSQIPAEAFASRDLSKPFTVERTFDLALTFEVAEHLPAESAAGFVASLVKLAPIVAFSAAVPGQGGRDHFNEQWPSYWVELFAAHDYVAFDAIRPQIWNDGRVAEYYAQNMGLFVDRSRIEDYPLEDLEPGRFDDLAHPRVYEYARLPAAKRSLEALRPVARTIRKALASNSQQRS